MKKYNFEIIVCCLLAAAVILGSCRERPEKDTTPAEEPTLPAAEEPTLPAAEEPTLPAAEEPTLPAAEEPVSEVPQILSEVYELVQEGQTNEALQRIEDVMIEVPDGPDRGYLLIEKLAIMLMQDRIDVAQTKYLEALERNPRSAMHAFGVIESYLDRIHDVDMMLHWTGRQLEADPPEELRKNIIRLRLQTLQRDERHDEVLDELNKYSEDLPHEALAAIAGVLAQRMIGEGELDQAERLRQWLAAEGREFPAYQREAALIKTALIEARQQWDALPGAVLETMPLLHAAEAVSRFDQWSRAALRARQHDVIDRMSEQVLAQPQLPQSLAIRVAYWQLLVPRDRGDLGTTLNRFEKLGDTMPPETLPPLFTWMSSVVFNEGTAEQSARFLELSDDLPWDDMPEGERERHIGILLDISFNASGFERTLDLLDEGVPERDERWHEVMRNKVLAHKAEEAGESDEAIKRYRLFMEHMAEEDHEGLMDPVTGHRVTGSMIQALNARRIGNLLAGDGRQDEAEEAFDEAAEQYRLAIEEIGETSPEAEWIREQLKAMDRL